MGLGRGPTALRSASSFFCAMRALRCADQSMLRCAKLGDEARRVEAEDAEAPDRETLAGHGGCVNKTQ